MDTYNIRGKIEKVYDLKVISDKFRKREFVLEITSQGDTATFIDYIKMQAVQMNCDQLEGVKKGDLVAVRWRLQGRKWKKNNEYQYFTNLEAAEITVVSRREGTGAEDSITDQLPFEPADDDPFASEMDNDMDPMPMQDDGPDDLPF